MKKVVKICAGEWKNASRDIKELSVIEELGGKIEVIAKGNKTGEISCIDGFKVFHVTTRPFGSKIPNSINRVASVFIWAWEVRKKNPDIISGHDLSGVLIGYIANICKKKKALLVYDSHEFEMGRAIKRTRFQKRYMKALEKFLISKCVFSIMVNDIIADSVVKLHSLEQRPIVVRNIPQFWNIDEKEITQKRNEILRTANWGKDAFIVMYHGMVLENRGVENIIELLSTNNKIVAFILGNCPSKEYKNRLEQMAQDLSVEERICFHEAVPLEELYKYVGAADVGMVLIRNTFLSYYYSLPNKFFENIQSGTPMISSNFPEMEKLMNEFHIGLTCSPDDIMSINNCVEKMRTDEAFYKSCRKNVMLAKKSLCWENEKSILVEAYSKIL